jgi:hypothetical protein
MEDLILGLHDYEDGETGDVYSLEGGIYESFKTSEYDGFQWEVGVLEETLAGGSSARDEEETGSAFDRTEKPDRTREGQIPTSRRANPGEEKDGKKKGGKGGGGGGLFGGGDEESTDEGEEILALRLRVVISFQVGDSDELLELETLAPFITDEVFEGIDVPESNESGNEGQGQPGQPGQPGQAGQGRDRRGDNAPGRALEEIFGDG